MLLQAEIHEHKRIEILDELIVTGLQIQIIVLTSVQTIQHYKDAQFENVM